MLLTRSSCMCPSAVGRPPLFLSLLCAGLLATAPGCTGGVQATPLDDSASDSTSQALSAGSAAHVVSGRDANLCLVSSGTGNGAALSLGACTGKNALNAVQTSRGQLKLGDKCLDVTDGKTANGSSVQLWDCFDNNVNQLFTVTGQQIKWTNHDMCLDLKDGVTSPQAALQIWQCAQENDNQRWTLEKQDSDSPAASPNNSSAAPTTSSPASPNTVASGRSGCKRGVAADAGAALRLNAQDLALLSSNLSWWYNWYLMPGDSSVVAANDKYNLDYVQMVSVRNTDFDALEKNLPPKARYLLTFNEPNFNSQANITPQEAASLWPKIEAFADKHHLLIVSPAMNYCWGGCNVGDPFDWLDQFFAACRNCRVDHIAVHAYTCDTTNLKEMSLDPFVKKYNRPLWLTEFDCADNGAIRNDVPSQKAFMKTSLAMLEAHPNVFRYAWFMAKADGDWRNIALLNSSGGLTELGRYYLSLPQACTP